jgi:lipoprotein-anchoring transpeptidase ErfK/SrfK
MAPSIRSSLAGAIVAGAIGFSVIGDLRLDAQSRERAPGETPDIVHLIVHLQVLLDRAGFSPGEIDGREGPNTERAILAFQEAHDLPAGDDRNALLVALGALHTEALTAYTVTRADVDGPFTTWIPADIEAQAKLPALHYTGPLEALAERFHAAPELLRRLNPDSSFAAGEAIKVPNVRLRNPSDGADAAGDVTVVVSEARSTLFVRDAAGQVTFAAPVTTGSRHDPLPLGQWTVTGIHRDPAFHYNPKLFWDADPSDARATVPAGPNNPVGVVWIDLSKEHYGIHGTPEPGRIGHVESHGCVRLTNWDALRVAELVREGTVVRFDR